MTLRAAKLLLVAALALHHALVVFNNLTDFGSNEQFVRRVLAMDTTFAGNHATGRAISSPALILAAYWGIILWEAAAAGLLIWAAVRMAAALQRPRAVFLRAQSLAVAALTASLLLWLVAFLTVGGEWFLMWQSATWNGQQAAFLLFTVTGLVLLIVVQPDADPFDEAEGGREGGARP